MVGVWDFVIADWVPAFVAIVALVAFVCTFDISDLEAWVYKARF